MIKLLLKYKRVIKYLIAGGAAASVDLGFLYFFTDILGIWYLISACLAFIMAFFVSFYLQKFWTFRDGDKEKMYKQLGVYLAVALVNLALNAALMYLLVDGLKIWYLLAQIMASGLIAAESYFVYKLLIFNKVRAGGGRKNGAKILIATGIYPPDFRGPATMLKALPSDLAGRGMRVKVITYSDIKASPAERGRVIRILRRGPDVFRHLNYFSRLLLYSFWADLIYATDIYSVGYFAYLAKKLTGRKYVIRFAGDSAWETAVRQGATSDYIIDFQK